MSERWPQRLGQYEIVELRGEGGFAWVYRARDRQLDMDVALKVPFPRLLHNADFVARFQREARAAARLNHPNIVSIMTLGETEGRLYIAMRYVDGPSLREEIEDQAPLPLNEAVDIVEQVAEALDYAHAHGLIHRDVKPSNILLDKREHRAVLTDFGIVKALEDTGLTTTGTVGTPEYMSPEQAESLALDGRSDVYALGVVAYHICTGQVPFKGQTPPSTLYMHVHKAPPSPVKLNPGLPQPVAGVLLRALAKKPEERYATAGEFARALRLAYEGVVLDPEYYQATALFEHGRYLEALPKFEKILAVNPGFKDAHEKAALCRQRLDLARRYGAAGEQVEQARTTLRQIRDEVPDYPDPDNLFFIVRHGRQKLAGIFDLTIGQVVYSRVWMALAGVWLVFCYFPVWLSLPNSGNYSGFQMFTDTAMYLSVRGRWQAYLPLSSLIVVLGCVLPTEKIEERERVLRWVLGIVALVPVLLMLNWLAGVDFYWQLTAGENWYYAPYAQAGLGIWGSLLGMLAVLAGIGTRLWMNYKD